jgi:hypothetical protein
MLLPVLRLDRVVIRQSTVIALGTAFTAAALVMSSLREIERPAVPLDKNNKGSRAEVRSTGHGRTEAGRSQHRAGD